MNILRKNSGKRIIVFLAAPPAVGKSTLCVFLEKLSKDTKDITPIQSLSLDGFHYPNSYLKSNYISVNDVVHSLYEIKGMPETYDLNNFTKYLKDLKEKDIRWPIYDRILHEPIMDLIEVTADIVLIEGNWLLLNEYGWRDLKMLCDYSIFIEAREELLRDRLIKRKMRGGLSKEEALEFYERTDKKNVLRVMENRLPSDITLEMLPSGENILKKCCQIE